MLTANRDRYHAYATEAAQVFKQHGALQVVECWGEDVPDGKLTSFPMAFDGKRMIFGGLVPIIEV